MHMYFSGNFPQMMNEDLEGRIRDLAVNKVGRYDRLISFYYQKEAESVMNSISGDKVVSLMLDSGAYSKMKKLSRGKADKVEISIELYMQFILEHGHKLDHYVNLDEIGDPDKSMENYKHMREKGFSPIPVYHIGEPLDYLWNYMSDSDNEYIGIGINSPQQRRASLRDLDPLFEKRFTDENGFPIKKFHGLGVGSREMISRYPWFSVDSQSWVEESRRGIVLVPPYENGRWIYTKNPWKVWLTVKPVRAQKRDKHYLTCPKGEQEIIEEYFRIKQADVGRIRVTGFDWTEGEPIEPLEEGLMTRQEDRDRLNVMYYLDLQKTLKSYPWPFPLAQKKHS